jgi:hypothetical protein
VTSTVHKVELKKHRHGVIMRIRFVQQD